MVFPLDETEEQALVQTLWGHLPPTLFTRLRARNLFYVMQRPKSNNTQEFNEPTEKLVIITCMDCQIDPVDIFQLHPGEALILRNGGNASTPDLMRSLIVAVHILGVSNIIVLGHTNCTFENLDAGKLDQYTQKLAKVNAQSYGFPDPDAFYRPFDDAGQSTRQLAEIIKTNPLFQGKIKVMAALFDDATGFVYDLETLQGEQPLGNKAEAEESAEPQIVIKPGTPPQVKQEIQKLIEKYPGKTDFIMKVMHKWQWDKYVHVEEVAPAPQEPTPEPTADEVKRAEPIKFAELDTFRAFLAPKSQSNTIPNSPAPETSLRISTKTGTTKKTESPATHRLSQAIVRPFPKLVIPKIVIPKIPVPRVRIPRFHMVLEYPDENADKEEQ